MAAEGVGRAADALLRSVGARTVLLRMAVPAAPGDVREQMGLVAAEFSEVELGPCVFSKSGKRTELLVSAEGVRRVVGTMGAGSAEALFTSAAGMVVDGDLFAVDAVAALEGMGGVACYRLTLRAA